MTIGNKTENLSGSTIAFGAFVGVESSTLLLRSCMLQPNGQQ